jgi:hypothetical protein
LLALAQRNGSDSARGEPPLTVDQLQGRIPGLEFHSLLGSGGMGAVYRARQLDLDRDVAVKVLPAGLTENPVFVERFRREARALARLDHPNIVQVFGSGVSDGLCYIVMEYVDGVTLREAITERAVDPASALRIAPQICEALEFAHAAGVVHRDIKPENILLGQGGKVKVADFGLAKLSDADTSGTLLTATGAAMGTLRYMAPEQFDGESIDHRADIYALGVVIYELLTGHVPMGQFPPPSETPGVDPRIDDVVMRTLQRAPGRRYQSISDVRTDLYRISKGEALPPAKTTDGGWSGAAGHAFGGSRGADWKSRSRLFGYPIVHVAYGIDPVTGRRRVAKGVIAIGDVAVGGFALGGIAAGLFAVGGCAFGLTALGGASIGLLLAIGGAALGGSALGGGAIGGVALGGAAIGVIAIGGGALGYVAIGGGAAGRYVNEGRGWNDPSFATSGWGEALLDPLAPSVLTVFMLQATVGLALLVLLGAFLGYAMSGHLRTGSNPLPSELKRRIVGFTLTFLSTFPALLVLFWLPHAVHKPLVNAFEAQQVYEATLEQQATLDAQLREEERQQEEL